MTTGRATSHAGGEPDVSGATRQPPDPVLASMARLAATVCQAPLASIAVPDSGVSCWCTRSRVLPADGMPQRDPFLPHVAREKGLFTVANAAHDLRVSQEECVTGALAVRSYAGIALRTANGKLAGTLAVYDTVPRELSPRQADGLILVAQQAVAWIEQRARAAEHAPSRGSDSTGTPERDRAVSAAALVESAPVAIYQTDAAGNLTYANPEYRRVFGLAPGHSANDWAQGVHPEDRPRMERAWAEFCANPRPMHFEYRTAPRAGGIRCFTESVVPVDGAPAFVGTISDVTDLVSARTDLRRVEALFRNTIEETPIGIAYTDRAGRFLRCNRAFSSLLGFAAEELESRSIMELTHDEDAALTTVELDRLWRHEVPFVDFEKRYRRKDGGVVWVRSSKSLVTPTADAPECLVEFVHDISLRKRLSAELEESRALLETLLANLPLALIACDAEGRVTHYNREAAEMCSMQRDESAAGTSDEYTVGAQIYHADGVTPAPRSERPLARTLRGETVENLELVIVPRDSTERVTLSNGRRLVGPGGRPMGALVVTQDITERKRSELELERVHEQLRASARQAGMAEVATNVLHNVGNVLTSINVCAALVADDLKRSKAPDLGRVAELLQAQGAQLGEFMTSDERGKLVPGYLKALGEQLVKDTQAALEHMASLRANLEHVKNAIAMQQNYAKITSVRETVNVVDLVEDSLRLSAGAFTRHGIELSREFDPTPPITVDKHKVLQILVNLVRNAKYACEESRKKDKLLTLRVESDARVVRISVIDNGVGIPAENMGRLFTHGFTTRPAGHGFGLHSAVIAAQELGGTLRAESAGPGQGATFILELPRDLAEATRQP